MTDSLQHTRVITVGNLLQILLHRSWVMILAFLVVAGSLAFYYKSTFTPKYQSTATLYILKQDDNGTSVVDSSSFSLALNVVNDCTFSLKSHAVIDKTINELGLQMTFGQLQRAISTNNPDKTRFLQVTVESDSPDEAKRIVDKLCDNGIEKISGAMGFQQANIFEYGVYNPSMSNHINYTMALVFGAVAALLVYVLLVVIYIMDDSLRTNEEITQALGVTFLGKIPNTDEQHGKKSGKYGRYGRYGSYGYGYGYWTSGKKSKEETPVRDSK